MVELRILGALRLSASDQRDVESLAHQAKRAALLAYLAAAVPRGPHRRDKLLALFWPELDEPRARAALSQAVYVLRSTLGEHAISSRGDGEVGLSGDVVWCDAAAFEAALDGGRAAEALALYRGDLLDGFFISDAPEFERWLEGERARLRQRAAEGAWALAEAKATEGEAFEAERWARWAADLFPADETVIRRLMTVLSRLGDRAAAIRAYEEFTSRLKQEYELEPSAETQTLVADIRQKQHRAFPRPAVEVVSGPHTPVTVSLARRPPIGWVAASIVGLIALAAGSWVWLRQREPSPPAVVRFTLEFPAGQQMVASGVGGSTIALSPDGSHLVYLGRTSKGTQLFLRPLDRLEAVPMPHTRGAQLPFFSPDGRWLAFVAGRFIRKVLLGGGPAITVCEVGTNVSGASWGPNDVIVFATPAGLSTVPASGGESRLLAASDTVRNERFRWPEILPNGRGAVFTRVDDTGLHLAAVSLETGALVPLGMEGTNPHFVTPGFVLFARPDGAILAAPFDEAAMRIAGAEHPVAEGVLVGIAGAAKLGLSRAGTIAYAPTSAGGRTLAMVHRSGQAEPIPVRHQRFEGARFSPDGQRIATVIRPPDADQPDIWLLDRAGSALRRVTTDGGSLGWAWSPDGRRLAFASKPGGRGVGYAVRWIFVDGGDSAETLLAAPAGFPVEFAPDGRVLILQERHPVTGWDIWMLPLDGERKVRPYLWGPADEHSAALSPDGRWLAYVSDESGRDEVYVRTFPRPGGPVQISSRGGRGPRWAPSGREIFYHSEEGMVAVPVTASRPFRVGRREVLFDDERYLIGAVGPAYDVHPDGRRFLMIRRGSEKPEVVVVLNWFAQLHAEAERDSRARDARRR